MIRLSLIGVRVEVPTNQPIVLLREEGGTRFLPIFIGSPEATAIVYALQGMETPRPMTHDLFKTVLDDLSVTVRTRRDHRAARRHLLRRDRVRPRRHEVADLVPALRRDRVGGALRRRGADLRRRGACSTRPACCSRPTRKSTKSSNSASSSTTSRLRTSPSSGARGSRGVLDLWKSFRFTVRPRCNYTRVSTRVPQQCAWGSVVAREHRCPKRGTAGRRSARSSGSRTASSTTGRAPNSSARRSWTRTAAARSASTRTAISSS